MMALSRKAPAQPAPDDPIGALARAMRESAEQGWELHGTSIAERNVRRPVLHAQIAAIEAQLREDARARGQL
ncbi:hypothetical protein BH24ACI4_BH24ACI4_13670 [soil metagenome]